MCDFCKGISAYLSLYHTVDITYFGKKALLRVSEKDRCPKSICCYKKDFKPNSVFEINFCPYCGRKLVMDKVR